METEVEGAGPVSTPRVRVKRSRPSTSSSVPPDTFQIILKRLDTIHDVQNQQTERMTAMQDQLDVLFAKFDSIHTS